MAEISTQNLYVNTQKMGLFSFCDQCFSHVLVKSSEEMATGNNPNLSGLNPALLTSLNFKRHLNVYLQPVEIDVKFLLK